MGLNVYIANGFVKFLKGLKNKMNNPKYVCNNCNDVIDEFNENEYFGISYKTYCSLRCFDEEDKNKEKRSNSEIQNSSQANKGNKRKNKVQSKRKQQKKRKTK